MVHISFIPLLMWWSVKKKTPLPPRQQLSCRPCSEEIFDDFDNDTNTYFNYTLSLENIKNKIRKRSFLLGEPRTRRKFRKIGKKRDVRKDLEKIFLMNWINSHNDSDNKNR